MFKVNIKSIRANMFQVKCMFKTNVLVFLFTTLKIFHSLIFLINVEIEHVNLIYESKSKFKQ